MLGKYVARNMVQLLATQKLLKRQKGKFALFWMLATREEGRLLSGGQLLPLTISGQELL